MEPNPPIGPLPWYVAVIWGVIVVVGSYCALLLLAWFFPRRWGRRHRERLETFRRLDSTPVPAGAKTNSER
jgi:hypothetical protein